MKLFDDFARLFNGSKEPSIPTLEKAAVQAERALETARGEADRLRSDLPAALLSGDSARLAHRENLRRAEADMEDAQTALDIVQQRLVAARAEAEEAGRRASYADARKARDAAAEMLCKQYPALVAELRALIEVTARADALVDDANAALPADAAPLARVEHDARDIPGEPRRILSERSVRLWCPADTSRPAPDQSNIQDHGGGRGRRHVPAFGGGNTVQHFDRREFVERRVNPGRSASFAPRIHEIDLPGFRANEAPGWGAMPSHASPDAVLAALAADPGAPAPEIEREVVEHELIVPVSDAAE